MDYTTSFIPVVLINSFTIVLAMTNLLVYPLRYYSKIIIFIYIAICQLFLNQTFGQSIIPFTLCGIIFIIAVSSRHFISNSFFSLIGYLFATFLNYALISVLNLLGITVSVLYTKKSYLLTFTIIYGVLTIITTYILGTYLKRLFTGNGIILSKNLQYLFIFEVIICIAIFAYNITQAEDRGYPSEIVYFNTVLFSAFFIVTLIIFFFCLSIIQKNSELELVKREKAAMEEYLIKLDTLYQDTRIFKHDYLNILSTMKFYIEDEDKTNLKEFFESKIMPTNKKLTGKSAIIDRLSRIRILELKGILYFKLISAMNQNLNITLEMHDDIFYIAMDALDLASIIGNYMDNAIEAALASQEKKLIVLLIQDTDSVIVSISNTADEEEIVLEDIYQKETSYKNGHSGLGLYSTNTILDKYDNIIHTTTYEEHIFTQTLEICNIP